MFFIFVFYLFALKTEKHKLCFFNTSIFYNSKPSALSTQIFSISFSCLSAHKYKDALQALEKKKKN